MGENLKLFLEIVTPICLAALFIINLLQSKAQAENKSDLIKEQSDVKEELHTYNGQVRDALDEMKTSIQKLDTKVEVHIARDEAYQEGLSRTLNRIDKKLGDY